MLPLAPPRFSTTIGWPRICDISFVTARAVVSVTPPGVEDTIKRTGLDGYDCARAAGARQAPARRTSARRVEPCISVEPEVGDLRELRRGLAVLFQERGQVLG